MWCLDGNHLKKALEAIRESGTTIPQRVKADFIDCRDEKHAKELVLVYSSEYAKVIDQGLYEFVETEEIDLEKIESQVNVSNINWEKFRENYYDEFVKKFNSFDNEDCYYPIVPRFNEGYEFFIIIAKTDMDANWLREKLGMQKMKSYKRDEISKGNIIDIDELKNIL